MGDAVIEKVEAVRDVPEGMRAFDRAEALAGTELITRSRMAVESLNITDEGGAYPLTAIVNKLPRSITNNGKWLGDGDRSDLDLFIVDKPATPMPVEAGSIPEGCEPFDIDRALAGDAVVTRDGNPVIQIHEFEVPANLISACPKKVAGIHPIIGLQMFTGEGEFSRCERTCFDLFMKRKTKTACVWVRTYRLSVDGSEWLDFTLLKLNERPTWSTFYEYVEPAPDAPAYTREVFI